MKRQQTSGRRSSTVQRTTGQQNTTGRSSSRQSTTDLGGSYSAGGNSTRQRSRIQTESNHLDTTSGRNISRVGSGTQRTNSGRTALGRTTSRRNSDSQRTALERSTSQRNSDSRRTTSGRSTTKTSSSRRTTTGSTSQKSTSRTNSSRSTGSRTNSQRSTSTYYTSRRTIGESEAAKRNSTRSNSSQRPVMSKSEWKRRKQKTKRIKQITILTGLAVIAILVLVFVIKLLTHLVTGNNGIIKEAGDIKIEKKLLTVDNNTRSEQELEKVKGIVIHNTGEPETTANSMWEYYESLADTGTTSESVHFLVDLDGEIIQCIPCNEIAFHAMGRNSDTIGIMYCYSNDSGIMTGDTYESMVELVAELIKEYDLSISDVQLHYDITGRLCPQYYVQNETEWQNFLSDVSLKLK